MQEQKMVSVPAQAWTRTEGWWWGADNNAVERVRRLKSIAPQLTPTGLEPTDR